MSFPLLTPLLLYTYRMSQGNDHDLNLWKQWQEACQDIGVPVSETQMEIFQTFFQQLTEANRNVNLTGIKTLEDFLYRHLLDSLAIAPLIPQDARLADIGSGAGFPAIPLAIVRPDVQVTAVESVGKKSRFTQSVQEALNLKNLVVLNERSEALTRKQQTRERFDIVTARAVASLPVLLELCLPLIKKGGQFLAMKGLSYESELDASVNAIKLLGGRLKEIKTFSHPRLEGARILVFTKVSRTPDVYPRHAGLPAKSPL